MDVFLYFYEPLPCGLDEIEDWLDQALGVSGEVTGSGVGENGSNIDLLISDEHLAPSQVVQLVRQALLPLGLPESSRIVVARQKFSIR